MAIAFALIAFAIWNTTPHISNAARGLMEGMKQNGDVEISIHQRTDAESNQYESHQGLILMYGRLCGKWNLYSLRTGSQKKAVIQSNWSLFVVDGRLFFSPATACYILA